jgi:hypothetical protein
MSTFYCLRFETPSTWWARSPYLYPPGTRWSSYTLRHWVPFSLPPTTRKGAVEVFDPASTQLISRFLFGFLGPLNNASVYELLNTLGYIFTKFISFTFICGVRIPNYNINSDISISHIISVCVTHILMWRHTE